MSEKIRWILTNTMLLCCLLAGFVFNINGLQNIALFVIWTIIIITPFNYKALEKFSKKTKPIDDKIYVGFKFIVTGVLLYNGMWITSVFYFNNIFIMEDIWERVSKL